MISLSLLAETRGLQIAWVANERWEANDTSEEWREEEATAESIVEVEKGFKRRGEGETESRLEGRKSEPKTSKFRSEVRFSLAGERVHFFTSPSFRNSGTLVGTTGYLQEGCSDLYENLAEGYHAKSSCRPHPTFPFVLPSDGKGKKGKVRVAFPSSLRRPDRTQIRP